MKFLLFPCLLLCISALNLRAAQSSSSTDDLDLFQPVELMIQLFGQAFDSTTQALETNLLQTLYPDNYSDIQNQLDQCEEDFWNAQAATLQGVNSQLTSFAQACGAADPTEAVLKLIQGTLAGMLVSTCQDLPVDLVSDVLRLLTNSLGFQPSAPQEVNGLYIQPLTQASLDVAHDQGLSNQAVNATTVEIQQVVNAINQVMDDFAANGSITTEELTELIQNTEDLFGAYGADYSEIIQDSARYISQAVRVTCAFATPALSLIR